MPGASPVRFLALAALIVSVALALWLLDVGRGWVVVGVVVAWVIASLVEWNAWSRRKASRRLVEPPGAPPGLPETAPRPVAPPAPAAPPRRRVEEAPELGAGPAPQRELEPEPPPSSAAWAKTRHQGSVRLFGRRFTLRSSRKEEPALPHPQLAAATPPPATADVPEPDPGPAPAPEPPSQPEATPEPDVTPPPEQEPEPESEEPDREQEAAPSSEPRRWNLWELERVVRDHVGASPAEADERSLLLLHLRQFAAPNGLLPADFDGLVRESFAPLIGELEQA